MLMPPAGERARLQELVARRVDEFIENNPEMRVASDVSPARIREHLAQYDFSGERPLEAVVEDVVRMLTEWSTHVTHPRYFGLFNPSVSFAGILADTLVAGFNPQLGAWQHHPAGCEIERHLSLYLAERFGWSREVATGTFTSGGSEANQIATSIALAEHFPETKRSGLRVLAGDPVLYVSEEGHHSFDKIAQVLGLGKDAARWIAPDEALGMRIDRLQRAIAEDRAAGRLPFLVVATAGSTRAGTIDPLDAIAEVAEREKLHFHVDGAWGGGAILSDTLRPHFHGIERAHTIAIDPHKWLSVPMGCGVLLNRVPSGFAKAFSIETDYVPPGVDDGLDWYAHSPIWSRRFVGLKLFLTLASEGREGYARAIEHQAAMAERLREKLTDAGWKLVHRTPLALVAWVDPAVEEIADVGERKTRYQAMAQHVIGRGRAWISTAVAAGKPLLRACITSYRTQESDLDTLIEELAIAREAIAGSAQGETSPAEKSPRPIR